MDAFLDESYFSWVFLIWILIVIIIAIINIVTVIKESNNIFNDIVIQKSLNNIALMLKLCMIPFFVCNYFIFSSLGFLILFPGGVIILPVIWTIVAIFTYFLLLTTSAYSIVSIIGQYKNKKISFVFLVINIVLQLIFVLDVVSYVYVYFKIRK